MLASASASFFRPLLVRQITLPVFALLELLLALQPLS